MLNDVQTFFDQFDHEDITMQWLKASQAALQVKNGNVGRWSAALDLITPDKKGVASVAKPYISITNSTDDQAQLIEGLSKLMPWRKGPFLIDNLALESEWQGDMKWQRLKQHIQPLRGRKVLDVGSGNGYFTLRMALEGAALALGIEPFLLFNYQFMAIKSLTSSCTTAHLLPIRLEDMAPAAIFDTVFSMGVLYHQRDHMLHLQQLKKMMAPEGELILETLIVDGVKGHALIPQDRYARMRNVHCLPSVETLKSWLEEAEFNQIKVINVCKTTIEEQRRTEWIGENSASLEDFLDPSDDNLTIEGLPAPKRVIVIAQQ
ncbi:MAG TPA: tRNA 5-methoxyuridine(34)/uridine 5-oxyacetic acid(34) synthase CmoB [Candidatus Thioglobus sp.]|jgi:tRNA (mo5U34)-methyltransferase|nr:tRNA 5-methoxyuridine(34)/uridine 5-oxyacetic acid(34) synthase CmoB [Candidatus Thioglobus sp.]